MNTSMIDLEYIPDKEALTGPCGNGIFRIGAEFITTAFEMPLSKTKHCPSTTHLYGNDGSPLT